MKPAPSHQRSLCRVTFITLVLLTSACTSDYAKLYVKNPDESASLGHAKGFACGTMFLGPTPLNFVPVMLNTRTKRAYQDALESVPGATALSNVTIKETWFWWVLGTTRCVSISAEAF